jgi:hypothetical protein
MGELTLSNFLNGLMTTTLEWTFIVRFSVGAVAGGLLCGLGFGWAPMLWEAGRDKPVQPAKAESPAPAPANPVASTQANPMVSAAIPPAASRQGPAAILIAPGSTVRNLKITNSTSVGAPMLVADGATIHGLEMTLNKVYGADEAVRLGDVFGGNIDSLLLDTRLPRRALREMIQAGASDRGRTNFKDKTKAMVADPAQMTAYYELAEKVWSAGKPVSPP